MTRSHQSSDSKARVPSRSEIAAIIAQADSPALRNLKITQCYSELSRGLAGRLGEENVNWCTFATWASRTAGRFIRLADLDERVRSALEECLGPGGLQRLRDALRRIPGGGALGEDIVIEAARSIAAEVSAEVGAGNLAVFEELAPLFSAMIEALDAPEESSVQATWRVTATLRPGMTSQGGQDLLREAVTDYAAAMREQSSRRKAELMLRANARVGAHEQIRLQPYIHRAMSAPLADAVRRVIHRRLRDASSLAATLGLDLVLQRALEPYRAQLQQVWLEVSTRYLMTLELPTGTLFLGRDLPSDGVSVFPTDLQEIQDPELVRILRIYGAADDSVTGSGAEEWSHLSDRLGYIFELFRSRQQDRTLFDPPFAPEIVSAITHGEVPLLGV